MTRYIERQLNHQRQLLTLELPEMLQDRSQRLNDRLKRILGLDDQQQSEPQEDLPEWRADCQSEEDGEYDEDQDHGLRGSAGDLLYDESRQYSKLAHAHNIEVVDALPSPACDTAKFAVISNTYLSVSLSHSSYPMISLMKLEIAHYNVLHTRSLLISVHHVVEQRNS